MAAWPESYSYPALIEKIQRAHDVVGGLNLMVDVLDAGTIGWEKRDRVVHLVDAEQGRVTDAIAPGTVFVPFNQPGLAANVLLDGSFSTSVTVTAEAAADDAPDDAPRDEPAAVGGAG